MDELKIEYVDINTLKEYKKNAKLHPQEQIEQIKNSIQKFNMIDPIGVWKDNSIIEGNGRYKACKQLGIKEVPIIRLDHLSDEERKAYTLAHNKLTMNSDFDFDILNAELDDIVNINMEDFGFDLNLDFDDEEKEIIEDEVPDVPEEPKAKLGDIYQLGNHRLMCGDSTKEEDVAKLMNGVKADMVFTDPPYGMKKENDGVANDNLNYDDLLEFNKKWIPITFNNLKDNGSWYCWGIDEPLMDIYSNILKPMFKIGKATFRNLITWDKGNGQGQLSSEFRMYPIADEKCLFVMCGNQIYGRDKSTWYEEFEKIRQYMKKEIEKLNISVSDVVTITNSSATHWFSKSQFAFPTEDLYLKLQVYAKGKAFNKQYKELKEEYENIKKEWYSTRAYFDNTHDNMNNVWHFSKTSGEERQSAGGHATPKPIALCTRAIKSSSRENENVLDVFGGSGSTLIACEQNNRNCYAMELEPKWVDVIIQRWENFTGEKAIKLN